MISRLFDRYRYNNGHIYISSSILDSAEYNPRAVDDASSSDSSSSSKKTSPRADSSESEEREKPKKEESSKEPAKPAKSSGSSDSDNSNSNDASAEDKLRSTRGLKAADFEPEEENPKIHGRYQKHSGSDASDDDGRRRNKRQIGRISYKKAKHL
ncbi:nucleolar and coiled-body phosphoprotein 1-like isoform X2 [Trichoplusia ni]|uniref:Nucleolar and coiled-body phosphoprotein 1-like isoform X2 n=1 Tax=Trichoplusia ni TaxID=7111 RepID=A0A7E5VV26_TRINI|nr:nucleolar and coiled-body phosphoprotein 1-like isoform X2 [Trichoplusia ni]